MSSKKTILLISLIIIFGTFISIYKGTNTKLQKTPETTVSESVDTPLPQENVVEEYKFTEEELKNYYSSYKNPFVLHIRKALNGYLAGTNEGMDTPDLVIKPDKSEDGSVGGLSSFSNEYYKSKFIVFAINDAIFGGKMINIVFQDKPDKLFNAWVYMKADNTYDLRGFWQNKEFPPSEMEKIGKQYKIYIEDTEHAL